MMITTCHSNQPTGFLKNSDSRKWLLVSVFFLLGLSSYPSHILIPMDAESQKNHLKAYGITYWSLKDNVKVQWLLNYRGGAFLFPDSEA